jgi:hypothetical protein
MRAPRAALVIQVARLLPRAAGRDLVGPIEQLGSGGISTLNLDAVSRAVSALNAIAFDQPI